VSARLASDVIIIHTHLNSATHIHLDSLNIRSFGYLFNYLKQQITKC
jgi:hypothetical protein